MYQRLTNFWSTEIDVVCIDARMSGIFRIDVPIKFYAFDIAYSCTRRCLNSFVSDLAGQIENEAAVSLSLSYYVRILMILKSCVSNPMISLSFELD